MKKAKLILQDGSVYEGISFGYEKSVSGEIVFNTALTGYPESLTDPSYNGQILVSTYPLIGNYGIPKFDTENGMYKFFESDNVQISALVVNDYSYKYSHWNASKSLADWLIDNKIPALHNIDTRELTKKLRETGTKPAKIIFNDEEIFFRDIANENLVAKVSINEPKSYGQGSKKIVLVDCGVKYNIIRCLLKYDTTVVVVPYDYDFTEMDYDGLFISNGPGDPKQCTKTIENLKKAFEIGKPIMGICLGNQLMALASGADTYKLKYGHRSHNQPVQMCGTDRVFISSQNHGYAVDNRTIKDDWEPYFINLNDGSNEGIIHKTKPFFSAQFHPEAASGPIDTMFLFEEFINKIS